VTVGDGFRFGIGFGFASVALWLLAMPFLFALEMENDVGTYVDPLTGCHYITPLYNHGFTPRLDAAGNHICMDVGK
jgi:hypothetical protein